MITLEDVSKSYRTRHGMREVLSNLNLTVAPGDHLGILGRNGAGKSTLVRLISGAERPTTGKISRSMSVSWPIAFSGGFHQSLSGKDNLRFICRIYGLDYRPLLDFVQSFSELGSYLDEPVGIYSSGMRAKLAFAISMVVDFDCYLIDEVMAVGDQRFREKCDEELFKKRGSKAMIIISHSMRYLQMHCNRFVVLENGQLEEYQDFQSAQLAYKSILKHVAKFEAKKAIIEQKARKQRKAAKMRKLAKLEKLEKMAKAQAADTTPPA